MPTTVDERCADANIFASARNIVHVHRRLQTAEDRYPVLPSAASAADAFTDASVCVCGDVHVVHVYGCVRKHTHVCAAMCWRVCVRERICVHPQKRSRKRPALSAPFPITQPGGREGERSWLSHLCLERQVGQFGSWNLTCMRCQRHATATKAYIWASAISWFSRWTLVFFIITWKLAGWSVHVYNTHSDFVKIVRIIIEFLWCVLSEAFMDILYLVTRLKVLLGFVSFHI